MALRKVPETRHGGEGEAIAVSLHRRAVRRDANEADIVAALEVAGAYVLRLSKPVDLLVGFRRRWLLLEVKDGNKPPSRQCLTDDQVEFMADCQVLGLPAATVRSVAEALAAIGAGRG